MMDEQDRNFVQILERVSREINSGEDLIGLEQIVNFKSQAQACCREIDEIKREDRMLRLGIVGEVKAGKSSFLNALIFEGEEFLPKAPTPMTAALTRIGYSKEPHAKIVYYSEADWNQVEKLAADYDRRIDDLFKEDRKRVMEMNRTSDHCPMPERDQIEASYGKTLPAEIVSCKELVRMAADRSISIEDYLGKTEEIKGDVIGELQRYVGAEGALAPIVKHTELWIDKPMLKGIEIVDTPGLNDPILSRSETTKQFLVKCDVVFLLSYVGQFLTSNDIQFLTKTLPVEGIRKAVIIGSKLDSGILDYNQRGRCDFMEAYRASVRNYNSQASANINRCCSGSYCPPVMLTLKESLPPKYVSSLMYQAGMSAKKSEPYSAEAQRVINNIKGRFDKFDESPGGLLGLAGIKRIKDGVLREVIQNKESILQDRISIFTKTQTGKFLSQLETINISVKQNLLNLQQCDQEQLKHKLTTLTEKLDSVRSEVKGIFESSAVDARKYIKSIEEIVDGEVANFLDFRIHQKSEDKHYTIRAGLFGWKKEHYTDTVTIQSADIAEVLSNLRGYADRCNRETNHEFSKLFQVEDLKRRVKNAVQGAFDLAERDFNENDILIPLENALKRLTIPEIRIESSGYKDEILNMFSETVVEGNQIGSLRVAQEKAISRMRDEVVKGLERSGNEIEASLQRHSSEFIDGIERQINVNIELTERLLEDKEASIRKCNTFIQVVAACKKSLSECQS